MGEKINYFTVIVLVMLVVSLGMNFSLLDQIKNQVFRLSDSEARIIEEVDYQTNKLHDVLNEFTEEQSLISAITMEINTEKLESGDVEATFQWQVKEYQEDADVVFHYAFGDTETYTSIPAVELERGLFHVKVPFDLDLEPEWEITSHDHVELSIETIEEASHAELSYYVSVSDDDRIKSGSLQTDNLGYLGMSNYGLIYADMHISDGDVPHTIWVQNHMVDTSVYIEEAYLLKYENSRLIDEENLELEPYDENNPNSRYFHHSQLEDFEDMRLVLKVIYNNGDTFEKEIY
ncbi:hypothetical protein J2T56_002995 [Natronobacillus azotifigens]|uniref:Uncharacterized protein n=1 Tax=Natronobacillus azotifigens TaxID=472978 RepID=A0A9J6RH65_9BACI|nr:hypothetical protein [Natronobacillus azotifigens]MCZ0704473.1 hypothetical protein [Natronobacillus azotifigens]